eukprot:m.14621 g.14621  ORF g.14621 m.14621 type:complete len:52 (+) comp7651_c0_seq1:338-493(+)
MGLTYDLGLHLDLLRLVAVVVTFIRPHFISSWSQFPSLHVQHHPPWMWTCR